MSGFVKGRLTLVLGSTIKPSQELSALSKRHLSATLRSCEQGTSAISNASAIFGGAGVSQCSSG